MKNFMMKYSVMNGICQLGSVALGFAVGKKVYEATDNEVAAVTVGVVTTSTVAKITNKTLRACAYTECLAREVGCDDSDSSDVDDDQNVIYVD